MNLLRGLALLAAMGIAGPAGAAVVHKCVGADGKATYSDKPCTTYQTAKPDSQAAEDPEAQMAVEPEPEAAPPPAPVPEASTAAEPAPAYGGDAQQEPSPEELQQMEAEQMAAIEAEWKRRVGSRLPLLLLFGAVSVAGWLWQIVTAARMDKIVWAVCLFLFAPISNIIFSVLNWQKAKVGFLVYMIGGALLMWQVFSLYAGMMSAMMGGA